MIVTCNWTIMDGQVARWYRNVGAERLGNETASVSRNAIHVEGDLFAIKKLMPELERTFERICRGEDIRDVATHQSRGLFGELEPIVRAEVVAGE